jgi:hypothetical protein
VEITAPLKQEVTGVGENKNMLGGQTGGQTARPAPQPTPICHITHVENLPLILSAGGLRACSTLRQRGVDYTNIAHQTIQDRRATRLVHFGPGGTLHDYVPFYFAPRSPMLYTISRGNVEGYAEGQNPVVHLVSTAQAVQAAGLPFVFTDGHGIMVFSQFYDSLKHLDQVDWNVMRSRQWADTPEDSDRKRRRQAEFLVHGFFPWNLVSQIGVVNAEMKVRVESLLSGASHQPSVHVRQQWYY